MSSRRNDRSSARAPVVRSGERTDLMQAAETKDIDMALAWVLLASSDEKVLSWVDRSAQDTTTWREASLISNSTIVATAEELKQIQDQIQRC